MIILNKCKLIIEIIIVKKINAKCCRFQKKK